MAERRVGFTLLETTISLGVFVILLGSAFSIAVEYMSFAGDINDEASVLAEGNRAYSRLVEVLRKSGRMEEDGISYPRVSEDGTELDFRVGLDLDGNGFAFAAATGDLEWDPRVFTVRVDESGDLGIFSAGEKVHHLGRRVADPLFETIEENATLHLQEIRIAFDARKTRRAGDDAVFRVQGGVHMRN